MAATALQFPTSYTRSAASGNASTPGDLCWRADVARLGKLAEIHSVDEVLNAAFVALVHRYTGQDDIVVGRTEKGAGLTGVQSRISADTSFAELVGQLESAQAVSIQDSIQVAFAGAGFGSPDGVELVLEVRIEGDKADFALRYDGALFAPEFIARLAANYQTLVADAVDRPGEPVHGLRLLADEEQRYLLETVNATDWSYLRDTPVHAMVEFQATQTPDAPALEHLGQTTTYRELNERANALARALLAAGVNPGDRIGVSLPRSARLVCLLLAVHKAGCAYVPLDPAYPGDRLKAIADTAAMSAVVVDSAPSWLADLDVTAIDETALWTRAAEQEVTNVDLVVDAAAASHLIYTSGSTGLPKGVVIHHRNVAALLAWAWETYTCDDVARVLFSTSLNFDLSVFELWCPLTMGGCVVVVDNVLALTEPGDLNPSLVNTVPSALTVLVQRDAVPASTTVMNVAGEPLPRELVNSVFDSSPVQRVYNLYGPSEDTTYSTYKCFTDPTADVPTIGVPIHNTKAYLLDARGALVPHGVVGELHLGGDGLSSGYINDAERTAAVFVDAPAVIGRRTLYRTGDLARWTENGELFFMGRKDNQVKIRGYRIELGEIESVLREVEGVRDVAALAVRTGTDTRLVCYVGTGLAEAAIGEHLRGRLPHYMQPAKIVIEPELPLLPNGKVDRKALAARTVDWGTAHLGESTLNAAQSEIAAVWSEVLGLDGIPADLDFFSIGGHSLLANLLAARLSERCAVGVRVSEIYEFRTVAAQADMVRDKRAAAPETLADDDVDGRLALADRTLRESAKSHGVPGAASVVVIDGRSHATYYGLDDLAAGTARDETSRQRVTCVTKVLVAYVALMLVDQGRLTLDDPLGDLVPEAARRRGGPVDFTLRQLLSHTSGIDDSYEVWNTTDFPDLASYVASFQHYPQVADPGEIFAYSACGTSIAALAIERVLGMSWRRAVNTMLLQPLGIETIAESLAAGDHYGSSVATGYLWNEPENAYAPFVPGPQTMANDAADSFSVCFTTEEVATLALFALDDGVTRDGKRLLSAELARQMRTPQIDIPGHHFMHSWGLGWLHFDENVFGFNSNGSGHHNFVQVFAETRTVLVMLANAYPTFGLYEDLVKSVTGEGLIRPGRGGEVDIDVCVGEYASDGYRLEVTRGPDRLRYVFFQRESQEDWTRLDEGDLVASGTGGFTSMSEKNVLAGSISFIWSTDPARPKFVRLGQRVARRVG
ncbi:amino acid adenylation domain-containing protein [Actinokineospora alba]|uniref:Amino acid adenylation domain-containing protein n=1 Tax=Actinokineospora alba TaxID=504798 RepID=A0A1H0QTI1_9PSEU|nr:amino acid adenylation domain-containing protein [Actinokineospora alba]SDI32264.1 amino acid adenylation domain-containing protein [Actinokineospora alba]SDP20425.1 amino acid adenylation domain-containing protein [Actinokineospora alba]